MGASINWVSVKWGSTVVVRFDSVHWVLRLDVHVPTVKYEVKTTKVLHTTTWLVYFFNAFYSDIYIYLY